MDIFKRYKEEDIDIENVIKILNEENTTNDKKNDGVIYTPGYIAEYIVENLNYNIKGTIIEPSVGHGIFVFKLIEYVEKKFKLSNEELKKWFEEKVYCFDINDKNIEDLKKLLDLFFAKKNIYNVSYKNIIKADTLFYSFNFNFDYSFGNPPYIRAKYIEENYLKKLKNNYSSCSIGNIEIYYAFMELMIKVSKISSFIVPNSYISNKSGSNIRNIMKERVDKIIDFKNEIIFKEARTYTSIYRITEEKTDEILYSNSIFEEGRKFKKDTLNNEAWNFNQKSFENSFNKEEDYSIYSSIATLKDKVYIIENTNEIEISGKTFYEKFYNGKKFNIEKDACVSLYKLTKLKNNMKIIFPYDKDFKIINEKDITVNYPNLSNYLHEVKEELLQRDKGKVEKYESWYAYGRKQGIKTLKENYFLFIPLMINSDSEFKIIEKDSFFLITSGFSIGLKSMEEANNLLEFFNKNFFNFIEIHGKIWPGKKPYYSFSKLTLEKFLN